MKAAVGREGKRFLRRLARWSWACVLQSSGLIWYAKRKLRERGAVVVLTFHRVLSKRDFHQTLSLDGMKVRLETFQQLVQFLHQEGRVADPVRCEPAGETGPLGFLLTFDDGWLDNYFALLATPGASPAVIFLCPGLLSRETPFWHEQVASVVSNAEAVEREIEALKSMGSEQREERLRSLRQQPRQRQGTAMDRTMSWEQVAALERCGIRFGSHTDTHQMLPSIPMSRVETEVAESIAKLERRLEQPCDLFAYPNGDWSPESRQVLADHGVRHAFTTAPGVWTTQSDRLAIPRINICEEKFVGPTGRFSRCAAAYQLVWRCWRLSRTSPVRGNARTTNEQFLSSAATGGR